LKLDGNPKLVGCVPSSASATVTYAGTRVTGLCDANATAIEAQQQTALAAMLPNFVTNVASLFDGVIHGVVERTAKLGNLTSDSETSISLTERTRGPATEGPDAPADDSLRYQLTLQVEVIAGCEFVTGIHFNIESWALTALRPVVSFARLVLLAQGLPQLRVFEWNLNLDNWRMPNALPTNFTMFSADLPKAMPSMTALKMPKNLIGGELPAAWANWTSLQELDLSGNHLNGTLPASWGDAGLMSQSLQMNFAGNPLSGTVPASWVHFSSGSINLDGTKVTGCMPAGLHSDLPQCTSGSEREATVLTALKVLLEAAAVPGSAGLTAWTGEC
jgi:hypothetical protein